MELVNGYYQDAEIRTYKVTDDQIFLYNKDRRVFEPLLEYQTFVMQYKNNLLVKKNIIELFATNGSVHLMYPDCDCPDEGKANEMDTLASVFANYEGILAPQESSFYKELSDITDRFCKKLEEDTERILLPFTPEQELEQLKKEIFDIENEIEKQQEIAHKTHYEIKDREYELSCLINKKMNLERELQ